MEAASSQVRNYAEKDFDGYHLLYSLHAKECQEAWKENPNVFNTLHTRPGYSPQKDLFILSKGERSLIGFGDIFSEKKIRRAILDGFVHPDYRRKGLAARMLEAVLVRSREIGAEVAHISVREGNRTASHFLSASGFIPKRCILELEAESKEIREAIPERRSGNFVNFKIGQEALLAQVQNNVFSGSWGFCPNTMEDIKFYLSLTKTRLQDVIVIKKGSKVAGYLWPQLLGPEAGKPEASAGRIHMFGIIPEFRERGLGRQLLIHGLSVFLGKGVKTVGLAVDELNSPALSLYSSLGFRVAVRKVWYEIWLK